MAFFARSAAGCRTGPPLQDAAPVLVADAGPGIRVILVAQLRVQGGDIVDGDQERSTRRGIAVVLGQVQHEIAARHLQV